MQEHTGKDWRILSYDEVRRFLEHLFSVKPRKTEYGIFVAKKSDTWHLTFDGRIEFYHDVIDGRPVSHAMQKEVERYNTQVKRVYANKLQELERSNNVVKPLSVNKLIEMMNKKLNRLWQVSWLS